jgi:glycosyltransferase involved in cell wall biosynthesis
MPENSVRAADESVLVSILTPSFNQAAWLADNLRSVTNQTYTNIEHIVMDGGSSDGSLDILRSAPQHVRWRSESDAGQSEAINSAFEASRGQIIGWLNSDDAYFDRHAVARAVASFERNPQVDVIYGHAALVNSDGLVLHAIWVPPFNAQLLRLHNYIIQPAVFLRRSALGAQLVDNAYQYGMDRELWVRLARDHAFMRLNKILAIDRHHPNRKAYTRLDLEKIDTARLINRYGVYRPSRTRLQLKMFKIAFRLMGVAIMNEVSKTDLAFHGRIDGWWSLLIRQVGTRRATMPTGWRENAKLGSGH